jgi:hypothetical protein
MTNASMRTTQGISVVGILLASTYAAGVAWGASQLSYQVWVAMLVLPLLLIVNLVAVIRVGRLDPDPRFLNLLVAAFALKLLATLARYLMAFVLYDGQADAKLYSNEGARLAASYRVGDFGADIGRDFIGTGFIRVFTGFIYSFTGPSVFVAYAVYSLIGFWGLYFLYRAFRVGVPDGDARRYSLLVLLLPSMLFWPSGLGKEAWMTLAIGLTAYGAALMLGGHRRWLVPLAVGTTAGLVVRPHIMAALVVGIALAFLVGRSPRRPTELTPVLRCVGALLVAAGAFAVIHMAGDFLGVDGTSASGIDGAIHDTADRTAKGGSQFEAPGVHSPQEFPLAMLSVLARPFPWEAEGWQIMIAAAEGTLVLALFAVSLPRLRSLPARLRRQPYLIMCLSYAALFVYAFSNFSNFGILTRERVQVLPFVLVLLALPKYVAPAFGPTTRRARLSHQPLEIS